MEISIDKQSKAVIVAVKGRMDGVSAPEFEKTMADHIASGASRFVVDCSALEYISSAGLRSLLTTAKTLRAATVNWCLRPSGTWCVRYLRSVVSARFFPSMIRSTRP